MKHRIILLCMAVQIAITQAYGGTILTVPEVNITPGGTAYVYINFDLGADAYTAYQFDIAYPEGISSVNDADGNPQFEQGSVYNADHNVSSIYTTTGLDRYQCFSLDSKPFTAQSGTLLTIAIKAKASMAEGIYQATIAPIEFVQTDATPDRPAAVTFSIKVTNEVVLNETATTPPLPATGVNVTVKRTINANEWSTICLPFAIPAGRLNSAFGCSVELANFVCYEAEKQGDDVVGIKVNFEPVTAIEANHPYLIKTAKAVTEIRTNGVNIVPEKPIVTAVTRTRTKWSEMVGTYVANTPLDEYVLFLSSHQFWYSKGATTMKAFRAYFDFSDVLTDVENAAGSRIKMAFSDGTLTGIGEAVNSNSADGWYHDLQGRSVAQPGRGVYLKDGKKIVNR